MCPGAGALGRALHRQDRRIAGVGLARPMADRPRTLWALHMPVSPLQMTRWLRQRRREAKEASVADALWAPIAARLKKGRDMPLDTAAQQEAARAVLQGLRGGDSAADLAVLAAMSQWEEAVRAEAEEGAAEGAAEGALSRISRLSNEEWSESESESFADHGLRHSQHSRHSRHSRLSRLSRGSDKVAPY